MPGDTADDGAADERAERDREAADAAPRAEEDTAAVLGHARGEDRKCQRHHDRAAEALQSTRGVERTDRRRERRRGRGHSEDPDPDREDKPATEPVAERCAGQEQDGEDERVGVHGPLETAQAGVQVAADHGDRRRDDEVVERDHEERGRRDCERPPHVRFVIGLLAALDEPPAPVLYRGIHRGEHVHQHAAREEHGELLGPDAGDTLHVGHEIAEAGPDDRADLRVLAGRVRLHLAPQVDAIRLEELPVGLADRMQGLLAPLPLRHALEDLERLAEAPCDHGQVELLLRAEQPEDVRLGDPRQAGDLVGRGPVQALRRKFGDRCIENVLAPLFLGLPF